MRGIRQAAVAVVAVLSVTGCSSALPAAPPDLPTVAPVLSASRVVGIYEPDDPGSYGQVRRFAAAIGAQPRLVSYYSQWGQPFAAKFATEVHADGGKVLVQVDPRGVTLSGIAAGAQDSYLRAYAQQVRAFGYPVVISFAQEMNGSWYPWGAGHVAPAVYVAAWRHIVQVFRSVQVKNVSWLWDVNCDAGGKFPIDAWWPGSSFVDLAGVDCYYVSRDDTFSDMFGATIGDIRRLTSAPVLVAETAAGPAAGQSAKITDLFAGIRRYKLLGFLWFDQAQNGGLTHQDWRLESDPAALANFGRQTRAYLRGDTSEIPSSR